MSTIDSGELREILKIVGVTSDGALDENGFPVEGREVLQTLRCKKKTVSTKEFIGADQQMSELTYKFICANRNIDNENLIEYKNKVFNIKHVHEIDDFFVEITASELE